MPPLAGRRMGRGPAWLPQWPSAGKPGETAQPGGGEAAEAREAWVAGFLPLRLISASLRDFCFQFHRLPGGSKLYQVMAGVPRLRESNIVHLCD